MKTSKAVLLAVVLSPRICIANGKAYLRSAGKGDNDNDELRNGLKPSKSLKLYNRWQLAEWRRLQIEGCSVPIPEYLGDGYCDGEPYDTEGCAWDGGDCIHCPKGYFGLDCTLNYPNCSVPYPDSQLIGDGKCDSVDYTAECGWEGGDCCAPDDPRPICNVIRYPNCSVPIPENIGDTFCDLEEPYYTAECGWDGGDCCAPRDSRLICKVKGYPKCSVPIPTWIGDGRCDGKPFDTKDCGWDGGDCVACTAGYVGPNCTLYYPNCTVPTPNWIGNGFCDDEPYNTTQCGWDGGDCLYDE
jgi:LNR domain